MKPLTHNADPGLLHIVRCEDSADQTRLLELMAIYPNATAEMMLEIIEFREGQSHLYREVASVLVEDLNRPRLVADDPFLQSFEWRRVRMMVLERDGARCHCCGRTAADGVKINVDHIKSRKRHPNLALDPRNLQVLCHECNHGKGNRYDTDWRHGARE